MRVLRAGHHQGWFSARQLGDWMELPPCDRSAGIRNTLSAALMRLHAAGIIERREADHRIWGANGSRWEYRVPNDWPKRLADRHARSSAIWAVSARSARRVHAERAA